MVVSLKCIVVLTDKSAWTVEASATTTATASGIIVVIGSFQPTRNIFTPVLRNLFFFTHEFNVVLFHAHFQVSLQLGIAAQNWGRILDFLVEKQVGSIPGKPVTKNKTSKQTAE